MQKGPDGSTYLATWQHAAERGSVIAREKLQGPEFPEELGYLWAWAWELFGRSGVGEFGLAPLSYATIAHWATLTCREPTPGEVMALLRLDAALREPEEPSADEPVTAYETARPAWPERKSTDG